MKLRIKKELEELESYLEGYRKETAQMALKVLNSVENVNVFLDEKLTYMLVDEFLKTDIYRTQDVAKMLSHTGGTIKMNDELSNDIKEKLAERKRNRGPFTLNLVERPQDEKRKNE